MLRARRLLILLRGAAARRAPAARAGRGLLLAFGLAVALVASSSCRTRQEAPALPHPLVLIGVDGLEWRLVLEMARAGRLPEIGRLVGDGTFAKLATLAPALSPPIWTSMATGVLPERHGILGFVRPGLHDAAGEPLLFTNRERRVKAIWNIAADAGIRPCVIGYWMTFPVEEIDGVMVAQTGAPPGDNPDRARKGALRPGMSGQVHPPALEERVFGLASASEALLGEREKDLFGDTSAWRPAMARLAERSRWSLAADSAYQRIALDLVADTGRCDLVLVYLGLADVLGHRFWRWTYPGDFASPPSKEEVALYGDVLRRAYVQIDAFVGQMRRAAGAGATVVVASDHGMGAFRPKAHVDLSRDDGSLMRTGGHSASREAFFAAAGPGAARAASAPRSSSLLPENVAGLPRAGSILDMTPTLLALLGLARGADMDGHAMTSLLDPAFVEAHPLREIPSHTPPDWAAKRRLAAAEYPGSAERIEQLRGLGYLE